MTSMLSEFDNIEARMSETRLRTTFVEGIISEVAACRSRNLYLEHFKISRFSNGMCLSAGMLAQNVQMAVKICCIDGYLPIF